MGRQLRRVRRVGCGALAVLLTLGAADIAHTEITVADHPHRAEFVGTVDCKKAELVEYAYKSSLEEIYKLGNPDLEERTRRYKILKKKGIQFPSSSKKRQRKPKNLLKGRF